MYFKCSQWFRHLAKYNTTVVVTSRVSRRHMQYKRAGVGVSVDDSICVCTLPKCQRQQKQLYRYASAKSVSVSDGGASSDKFTFDANDNSDSNQSMHTNNYECHEKATDPVKTPYVHDIPFQIDEMVLLMIPKNQVVIERVVRLQVDKVHETAREGFVSHNDIIGQLDGTVLRTSTGYECTVSRMTLESHVKHMTVNVITPSIKVLCSALSNVGVMPGYSVLEAGSGGGVSALNLSRAVGPLGHIDSIERKSSNFKLAQKNFRTWCNCYDICHDEPWPRNVVFHQCSLTEFRPKTQYDFIFLDLPNPHSHFEALLESLKYGKCIMVYTPSPTRIVRCLELVKARGWHLVLEDVWEESEKHWYNYSRNSRQRVGYSTGSVPLYPTVREIGSAFIAVFRKILPDRDLAEGDMAATSRLYKVKNWLHSVTKPPATPSDNNIKPGDFVMFRTFYQHKKLDKLQLLPRLVPGKKFGNNWASLEHDALLGEREGSVVRMSHDRPIYAMRPTLEDFLRLSWRRHCFRTRHFNLMRHLVDCNRGDAMLVFTYSPGPLSLVLSRAVGERGSVAVVCYGDEGHRDALASHWAAIQAAHTGRPAPDNVHVSQHRQPTHSPQHTRRYDGVCMVGMKADLLQQAIDSVKPNRYVIIMIESIDQVLEAVKFAQDRQDEVRLIDVTEDRERRWKVHSIRRRLDKMDYPYVCRPRPEVFRFLRSTAFLVRLKKVSGDYKSTTNQDEDRG